MEYLGYFLSIIIGISLGLIGSGGSIITVPILVYLFAINPLVATSYSLLIVGITAFIGTVRYYQSGNLHVKTALYFAITSVITLLFVRNFILPIIPVHVFTVGSFIVSKNILLMVIFALLMLFAAMAMIHKKSEEKMHSVISYLRISIIGFLVGIVTGFLGAGGGFLIIPALIFFAKLPMKKAVGTSLLIITINSLIGFTADVLNGVQLNYKLLFSITAIAIVGMFIGIKVSAKINGEKLKPAFGWFVLVMGIYIITKELFLK